MKTRFKPLVVSSVLILGCLCAETAWAQVVGKVILLETVPPQNFRDRTEVSFRVVIDGTCGVGAAVQRMSIRIRKPTMFAAPSVAAGDESASFRNAYSTLLAAFLAGNTVQITGQFRLEQGGEFSCEALAPNFVTSFDTSRISIFGQ